MVELRSRRCSQVFAHVVSAVTVQSLDLVGWTVARAGHDDQRKLAKESRECSVMNGEEEGEKGGRSNSSRLEHANSALPERH